MSQCVFASMPSDDPQHSLERRAKTQCIQLIFRVAERQRLPLSVASTGSILFHLFYESYTFAEYNRFHVAVASCCLAAKIEFRSMSLRDLVMACLEERYDRVKHPDRFEESSILAFRRRIHEIEQILLLDIIHFDFDLIQGPHAALAALLSQCRVESNQQQMLHEVAWSLANDSAWTTLSLIFSPTQLAKGLLHLAVQWSELEGVDLEWLWRRDVNGRYVREKVEREMRQIYVFKSET